MLLQPTHELTIDSFADVVLLDNEMSKIHMTLFVSNLGWKCLDGWQMPCPLGFQITK